MYTMTFVKSILVPINYNINIKNNTIPYPVDKFYVNKIPTSRH